MLILWASAIGILVFLWIVIRHRSYVEGIDEHWSSADTAVVIIIALFALGFGYGVEQWPGFWTVAEALGGTWGVCGLISGMIVLTRKVLLP